MTEPNIDQLRAQLTSTTLERPNVEPYQERPPPGPIEVPPHKLNARDWHAVLDVRLAIVGKHVEMAGAGGLSLMSRAAHVREARDALERVAEWLMTDPGQEA